MTNYKQHNFQINGANPENGAAMHETWILLTGFVTLIPLTVQFASRVLPKESMTVTLG